MPHLKSLLLISVIVGASACTSSHLVQPLHKGQLEVGVDAGGPIFRFGENYIPMPLSAVSASYGFRSDLSLFGRLHTTAAAYGVAQIDIGALKELRSAEGMLPGISIAPALNLMADKWDFGMAAYPSIDINAYWPVYEGPDFFYVGLSNWFELRQTRAHGEDQPTHWIPSLQAGYTWIPGKFRLTAEAKYLAPLESNQNVVVEYLGPFDYGTLGIYISGGYRF